MGIIDEKYKEIKEKRSKVKKEISQFEFMEATTKALKSDMIKEILSAMPEMIIVFAEYSKAINDVLFGTDEEVYGKGKEEE